MTLSLIIYFSLSLLSINAFIMVHHYLGAIKFKKEQYNYRKEIRSLCCAYLEEIATH